MSDTIDIMPEGIKYRSMYTNGKMGVFVLGRCVNFHTGKPMVLISNPDKQSIICIDIDNFKSKFKQININGE